MNYPGRRHRSVRSPLPSLCCLLCLFSYSEKMATLKIPTILGSLYRLFRQRFNVSQTTSGLNAGSSISCDHQSCALLGIFIIKRFQEDELDVRKVLLLSLLAYRVTLDCKEDMARETSADSLMMPVMAPAPGI